MRRFSFVVLLIAVCSSVGLVSCSKNNSAPDTTAPVLQVFVSPDTVSVSADASRTTQFTASIANGTNNIVIWKVNDVTGGNSTVGTIDSNGLYTPPPTVPSGGTVTVSAVSFEDPKVSGKATVTILASPTVTVSPTSATLVSGAPQTFTATVTGAPTTNVDWKVRSTVLDAGVFGGNATLGFINNSTGVYTAPLSPPPGGSVIVTAVSRDSSASLANATVTITSFAKASLKGQYAFSISGRIASGPFFRAGSFTADGNGLISAGLEDIHDAGGATVTPISFSGSYTVGADGRGTMQFADGRSPNVFNIAVVNNNQIQIIGFDATGTATGEADLQNPATFSASNFAGTYVFDFTGIGAAGNPLSQIGEFTADGFSTITSGLVDTNDNGAISAQSPFAGTYSVVSPSSNGRGTATLGASHFAFYIVSRGSARFVQIDPGTQATAGFVTQQSPNLTFGNSSLNGNFAFLLSGNSPTGKIATGGTMALDGSGTITSGVLDENINGVVTSNGPILSGTYVVASTGRGTATFTTAGRTYTLVFYLGPVTSSATLAVLQETDSTITSDGLLLKQQTTTFAPASLPGSYALQSNGAAGASTQIISGQLKSNGAGTIPSGTIDINTAGTLTPAEAVTGTYTVAANSRGTLVLNPATDNRNFAIYVVSTSTVIGQPQVIMIGIDTGVNAGRLAAGQLFRQF